MNIYAVKILCIIILILLQGLFILEIERCWFILKGKKSTTATKFFYFLELPFEPYVKDKKKLRWIAVAIYPLFFGIITEGIIPFLNYYVGLNIKIGFPWGYVATFAIGYIGIYFFIIIAYVETKIANKVTSISSAGNLLILYSIFLFFLLYFQLKLFCVI